jgi:hypothetical protein
MVDDRLAVDAVDRSQVAVASPGRDLPARCSGTPADGLSPLLAISLGRVSQERYVIRRSSSSDERADRA